MRGVGWFYIAVSGIFGSRLKWELRINQRKIHGNYHVVFRVIGRTLATCGSHAELWGSFNTGGRLATLSRLAGACFGAQ